MPSSDRPAALRVETSSPGTVVVSGELDMATAPQLSAAIERLVEADMTDIVLDLGGLTFCDSSGLSLFVQTHQNLRAAGGSLLLRHPPARLRALLATTALDHELDIS